MKKKVFHRLSILLNRCPLPSHIIYYFSRYIWVGMHKPQCGGDELSNGWTCDEKSPKVEERVYRSICILVFCGYLCHFLEWAQIVFCCVLFSSLAVEPFNTQPQLYYIALSRSYKGSFSAWRLALADIFLFKWLWQHALSYHSISCLPLWNMHLLL